MKTYLIVWFSSDGARPSEVRRIIENFGFKPMTGPYDFYYDWGKTKPTIENVLLLGDTLQQALKKSKVLFKLETV
ncbi:MAG: hypothetical protein QW735_02075 [archaeon]